MYVCPNPLICRIYHTSDTDDDLPNLRYVLLAAPSKSLPAVSLGHRVPRMPVLAAVLVNARVAIHARAALETAPSVV